MPVVRTRAGYSAATMPFAAVWLPTVQLPMQKIAASNSRYGMFNRPIAAIISTPMARLTAITARRAEAQAEARPAATFR